MEFTEIMRTVIFIITAVGVVLGSIAIYKIYSKEGFR